jgi:allantoin racemase
MRYAAMIGAKFGVVAIGPTAVYDYEQDILMYGLRDQAVRTRPIPKTSYAMKEVSAEGAEEQNKDKLHTIEVFKEVARELIADGAEVIIPGCGQMAPNLRMAYGAEKEYPNGLTEVDGVPVLDVMGTTIKTIETLVALKQAGSAWISRKGFYAQAIPRAIELGQQVLKYDGPSFWDY